MNYFNIPFNNKTNCAIPITNPYAWFDISKTWKCDSSVNIPFVPRNSQRTAKTTCKYICLIISQN